MVPEQNFTLGVLGMRRMYGKTIRLPYMGGALTLAIDKVNEDDTILSNGYISYDITYTYCSKRKSLLATNEFILFQDIAAIIGDSCPTTTEFSGLLAAEYNVPFIGFSPVTEALTDRKIYDTLTMVKGSVDAFGDIIIQIAHALGLMNICILVGTNYGFTLYVQNGMEASAGAYNVTILTAMERPDHVTRRDLRVIKTQCRGNVEF